MKPLTTIEIKAIERFDEEFGTDKSSRFEKVREEFNELESAISEGNEEHIKDEISDLYATVTHFASLYKLNHIGLLEMALDKVDNRKTNPDYKRFRVKKN